MGMVGNLKDMAVADLIQHNCQDRKAAMVSIRHGDHTAELFFKDGNILHAVLDESEEGEEVVYQVLSWEDGSFSLETGIEPPAVTIARSWTGLLLEGARRLDEYVLENQKVERMPDPIVEPTVVPKTVVPKTFAPKVEPIPVHNPEVNPMALKLDEVLKEMSGEVPGYIASAVIGMDGLNIAQHSRGKLNSEAVSAQMALFFKLVDTTSTKLGAGAVEDDLLTTENAYLLMRYLPEKQYFLGMAVDRKNGNLGNMRLISKMFVERINKALPR